jgi:hypothetical protein
MALDLDAIRAEAERDLPPEWVEKYGDALWAATTRPTVASPTASMCPIPSGRSVVTVKPLATPATAHRIYGGAMKAVLGTITLAAALIVPAVLLAAPPAGASPHLTTAQYDANSIACNASINAHKAITAKEFTTCTHSVVVEPNPCPSGQKGVIVDGGPKGSKIVNNYTLTYSLHVGAKPFLLKGSYTEAQADKGCRVESL